MSSEREKMVGGDWYDSRDAELLALYRNARSQLAILANAPSSNVQLRAELWRGLLGSMGTNVWIESPFYCDYGANIHIGNNCFVNYNCIFIDGNSISIGNDVLVGPAAQFYTATHPLAPEERITKDDLEQGRTRYLTKALPILIGDGAWIGGGAIILPGITVGAGTTIGAGSVVTRSIPDRCFAAGNPCRVIREL